MSDLVVILMPSAGLALYALGLFTGGWLRDSAWRAKANGPSRMLSGGRFYHVLTSETFHELEDARYYGVKR